MRRGLVGFCAAWLAAALAPMPVDAQVAPRTAPFDSLAVTVPAAPELAAQALAASLAKAVEAQDIKALTALLSHDFVALACSTDPLKPCAPGKASAIGHARTAIDRLRLALCCDGKDDTSVPRAARDESVFGVLASLLQSATPGGNPDLPGAVCLPGVPVFDRARARAIAKTVGIDPEGLRVATAAFEARERPDKAAPVRHRFGSGAIVPFAGELTTSVPDGWTALALPEGGIGYTDALAFDELTPQSLCLRQGREGWRVSVLNQRGN